MKTNDIKLFFLAVAALSVVVACHKDPAGKDDPEPEDTAINLSASGTANCYIVAEAGEYKFNAEVKGCSTESVGVPVSAEVLWESFGSKETPDKGAILTVEPKVKKGHVYFKTPEELNNGNAVIAVKNSDGEIIWSWHIWVVKGFAPTKENQQVYGYNAGVMMCCNLGATPGETSLALGRGLLYQWGRKDPFPGAKEINGADFTPVASTAQWPAAKNVKDLPMQNNNTLAFAIANPTTFIVCTFNNRTPPEDWYCTDPSVMDKKLWDATKTKYDPCPPGWRVPEIGNNHTCVWQQAFGIEPGSNSVRVSNNWTNSYWDFSKGMSDCLSDQEGEVLYPAPGGLSSYFEGFSYYDVGKRADLWTSSYRNMALMFSLSSSSTQSQAKWDEESSSCAGCSVRCIAE